MIISGQLHPEVKCSLFLHWALRHCWIGCLCVCMLVPRWIEISDPFFHPRDNFSIIQPPPSWEDEVPPPRYVKPADLIFLNCRSWCITGQDSGLWGKWCLPHTGSHRLLGLVSVAPFLLPLMHCLSIIGNLTLLTLCVYLAGLGWTFF